jgi:hypothetical protein
MAFKWFPGIRTAAAHPPLVKSIIESYGEACAPHRPHIQYYPYASLLSSHLFCRSTANQCLEHIAAARTRRAGHLPDDGAPNTVHTERAAQLVRASRL